ncbi:MAG: hypothetical protein ACE5WD_05895 [Candidatus Aminicenantia bacterium]
MLNYSDIFKKATIIRNGAVLLGKSVVCDAHVKRPLRIVTHVHWDHLLGLTKSIKECEKILMTPASQDSIKILRGEQLGSSEKIQALPYEKSFEYQNEEITFYPAGHIFGSAQVLVETEDNVRIVYTGDFKLPQAESILSDILVMEATYGNPENIRKFKREIEDELISLVKESLPKKPVWILGFHGKLQEILALLQKEKFEVPIVLQDKIYKMAKVCQRYGLKLGGYISASSSEGEKLIQRKKPFLALFHAKSEREIPLNGIKITLSGWEFEKPVRRIGEDEWVVAFSDHSDFEQLLEYVEKSKPQFVITDNYRVGDAPALAKEIEKRLGIPAGPRPV